MFPSSNDFGRRKHEVDRLYQNYCASRFAAAVPFNIIGGPREITAHSLTKYGIAISAIPIVMSRIVLETRYGKIIKATPQINGTTAFCLRP
jgi:hypothetical protein